MLGGMERHAELGSTNDRARELARAGAEHGYLVWADRQTAGRGRKGAEWWCAPGRGLAFSVVVRPRWERARWGWLGLGAGLGVAEALEGFGFRPAIKWPNDLLLGGRKVCGILVESDGGTAVAGIGLNVNEERFPEGIEGTSLFLAGGKLLVREEVLEGVWKGLMMVTDREIPAISEAVWDRLAWREAVVETSEGVRGRIRGFGANGELSIESGTRLVEVSDAGGVTRVG